MERLVREKSQLALLLLRPPSASFGLPSFRVLKSVSIYTWVSRSYSLSFLFYQPPSLSSLSLARSPKSFNALCSALTTESRSSKVRRPALLAHLQAQQSLISYSLFRHDHFMGLLFCTLFPPKDCSSTLWVYTGSVKEEFWCPSVRWALNTVRPWSHDPSLCSPLYLHGVDGVPHLRFFNLDCYQRFVQGLLREQGGTWEGFLV